MTIVERDQRRHGKEQRDGTAQADGSPAREQLTRAAGRKACRYGATLLASLCLVAPLAVAQQPLPLAERLAAIHKVNRFDSEHALPGLLALESEARRAPPPLKSAFLAELCLALTTVGEHERATAVCNELIAIGQERKDNAAIASGMVDKGTLARGRGQLAESHKLFWNGERLAETTGDIDLRVRAAKASATAYAEAGNFPVALGRAQAALSLARQGGDPALIGFALRELARQYRFEKDYDHGFAAVAEGMTAARQANSPALMALLKDTESGLATETGQLQRSQNVLLESLAIKRKQGIKVGVAQTLVNLADCYLKLKQYARAAEYAREAVEAAQLVRDESVIIIARFDLGEAMLYQGQIAEGKRNMTAAIAPFERTGHKPDLQALLTEYGQTLEAVGDMAAALQAYRQERKISDELFEEKSRKAVLDLQQQYEADKKQREITLLQRENQLKSADIDRRRLQQRVWWLLGVAFALFTLIVGMLYRKVREANRQLEVRNLSLKEQSVRDPLTGLFNRRHFQQYMRQRKQQGERRGTATPGEEMVAGLFLLDVDHFKQINDRYGHAAGDAMLKAIAASLREILRETDMIVRWGGEEFLVFLPTVSKTGLDEMAQRLLAGISRRVVSHNGQALSARVSIGFAPYPLGPAGAPLPWERVVNVVDMALYLAKKRGRNRAVGVRSFAAPADATESQLEQDLEQAWHMGQVDLAIIPGRERGEDEYDPVSGRSADVHGQECRSRPPATGPR